MGKAGATVGVDAVALVGATLRGDAALLVDASRHLLVVGLERLGEVAVCEVHDSDPSTGAGPEFDRLRSDSSLR